MARSEQKLKIIYLVDILKKNADEAHPISMQDIIKKLEFYNIRSERKSIYSDILELNEYGLDIRYVHSKGYYIANREFELSELKLLIDAVQASKFITLKKSEELIKKLEGFTSKNLASQLQHSVVLHNRIKSMNESVLSSVDTIHEAINKNKKVMFRYFDWDVHKQKKFRKDAMRYFVSPIALVWDDEKYYLVAYDSEAKQNKNYRIDKMTELKIFDCDREGCENIRHDDLAKYSQTMFSMYGGDIVSVRLRCKNELSSVIMDIFGNNIIITPDGDWFETTVTVAESPVFLSRILQFGSNVKIISPQRTIDAMNALISDVSQMYKHI